MGLEGTGGNQECEALNAVNPPTHPLDFFLYSYYSVLLDLAR